MSETSETPAAQTAKLEIVRKHPQDIQDRPVYLWIDGVKSDRILRYGMTFQEDIPPGHHKLKAHNTLFGTTVEFDAAPGETIRYTCENGLSPGGIVMVLMMGVAYLKVRLTRV